MSLAIKALLLFWPFIKRAIFGDRTIKEVVLANKHMTVVNVCMVLMFLAFMNATIELSVVKSDNLHLKDEAPVVCPPSVIEDTLSARRKAMVEFLK